MAARTAAQVFAEIEDELAPVPQAAHPFVCKICLGPVPSPGPAYQQCFDCLALLVRSTCPRVLRRAVVPMSIAINRGPWYSVLWTYKRAQFAENAPKIAALTALWLQQHEENLADLLGGTCDILTIVPSKRGTPFAEQRLRKTMSMVKRVDRDLRQTLEYVGGPHARMSFTPDIFAPGPTRVRGQRVVLIEDSLDNRSDGR